MSKSSEMADELLALKSEMSRLLKTPADDMFDAARDKSEALVERIKAALDEFGETLSEEEEHVERLIAAAASYRKSRSHTKCPRAEPRTSQSRS